MTLAGPAAYRSGSPLRLIAAPTARFLVLSVALSLIGLLRAPARAADLPVSLVSITSPAAPFTEATLTIRTTPGANCSITVSYKSGPSRAKGLIPKITDGSGRITWTWRVGSNTTPGRWPISVTCAKGADHGELRT